MIVVDATSSAEVAMRYPDFIQNRIAVITPNKRSNTLDLPFYDRLHELAARHGVPYLYETTVGAGLPVISSLRDLIRSGDEVLRIEGVFSGTLAYVFSQLDAGRAFSEIVREARMLGFTEPDPRDDLKGEDVARKLLIVAREMGMRVERADVSVESLVPAELLEVSLDEYMDRLEDSDEPWAKRVRVARESGQRLHYIGTIEGGHLSVRVRGVDAASPFAHLRGTNCMFLFKTERYFDSPLVIQGPGAGPAVTAAGIVADLLRAVDLSR
jgi:bifunctional aspartokinase / homoserine dehydrogenase 1